MTAITIPELSLVVLVGSSGSGKSSFASRHFLPTEVISSDRCRGFVSDDENNQSASTDAFAVLHFIAAKRLSRGLLTVIDATNVRAEDRKPLVELAREYHCLPVAVVFDLPEKVCAERNASRPDRQFGPHVVRQQTRALHRSMRGLAREGFRHVFVLKSADDVDAATVVRQPLWNNLRHEHGPFDIVGDVHGCFDELVELLGSLGYSVRTKDDEPGWDVEPPAGRKLVLLGDLVDRGPRIVDVLRLAMQMHAGGRALVVPGNHDVKLMRALRGKNVQTKHGLAESLEQLGGESPEFRMAVADWIDDHVSHYVLDDGALVVAHAGMKQEMQGRGSGRVREFALFGETTGETDEFGLPVRYNWASDYRGGGPRGLRSHPRAGTRMAEPHNQHRHRLRFRRETERAALPRIGDRLGTSAPDVLRARQAACSAGFRCGVAQRATRARRPSGHQRRARKARHRNPASSHGDHPRGAVRAGTGGDEPLRRESQVAPLPAPHDVAPGDVPRERAGRRAVRLRRSGGRHHRPGFA